MLGLSLWEGRLPGQKTIENEGKAAMGSYRPESNFGTSDTVTCRQVGGRGREHISWAICAKRMPYMGG